jgi:hypothetical protein
MVRVATFVGLGEGDGPWEGDIWSSAGAGLVGRFTTGIAPGGGGGVPRFGGVALAPSHISEKLDLTVG